MRYAPLSILVALTACASLVLGACGGDDESIILATTTSTENSGLLDELIPLFEDETGIEVRPIAVGTGAALARAEEGNADVVLVHALESEQVLVDAGHLVEGRLVMYNDFVIVGPSDDPAGVGETATLTEALSAIQANGGFISRGDDSGTHKKELEIWDSAGIDPGSVPDREETGQGMGATLNVADQRAAYTLTDRGTFLALSENLQLEVVFEGAPELLNIYHIYLVNPEMHDGVNADPGREFIDFFADPETQAIIGGFGVDEFGEPLFVPAAGTTVEALLGGG